jgi:inner membrane protein
MHLPTHFFLSWAVAEVKPLSFRDRWLVAMTGIAPDLDGLGIIQGVESFQKWHHTFGHALPSGICILTIAILLSKQKSLVPWLCLGTYYLHILCDFFGSGGPEGSSWPILFFWPVSDVAYYSPYQWELNSPINITITILAILALIFLGARRERTPMELFSKSLDQKIVEVFKRWTPNWR